jgi:DNA replication ATP-dependent helicase Dna2
MTKRISPSRVANYFFFECQRFLRFSSTPNAEAREEGIPVAPMDTRVVAEAILDGGYAWEEEVVTRLGDRVLIAETDGAKRLSDRHFEPDETGGVFEKVEPGQYIYQPSLEAPDAFYESYGIDPSIVLVSPCRPDLVECYQEDGRKRLRVIDVKNSLGVKLSHRIQATFYGLILEHCLDSWAIEDADVSLRAGIWLGQAEEPDVFDTRGMRPPLETFLSEDLMPLMSAPPDAAAWHVQKRCEWCGYFEHCRTQMRAENGVSKIPFMTPHARHFLGELTPPIDTLEDFASLLDAGSRVGVLDDCASLRGEATDLRLQTEALQVGQAQVRGRASLAMPIRENVRIVLTLQREPVSGHFYAFGIYPWGYGGFMSEDERPQIWVHVAPDPSPASIDEAERAFVRRVYELLKVVHDFNVDQGDDWLAQKGLQCYVYDSYEQEFLTELLVRRIEDPVVREQALEVFFHFQRPELIEAEQHPEGGEFFPLVDLSGVVRSLFALPLETSYPFPEVVAELPRQDSPFDYRRDDLFDFELSNQLRSDAIFQIWEKGRTDLIRSVEKRLKARLWATSALIEGIRHRLDGTNALFAWPPKFRLPGAFDHEHPLLSRLAFIARYESLVQYLQVRTQRSKRLENSLADHDVIEVTSAGSSRFDVHPRHGDVDLKPGPFRSWILSAAQGSGLDDRLRFDDFKTRTWNKPPKHLELAVAQISDVYRGEDKRITSLTLDIARSPKMSEPKEGASYLLSPRYTDYTYDKVLKELREIDEERSPDFIHLIEDPLGFAGTATPLPGGIRESALSRARERGTTASQKNAMQGFLDKKVQLVWGPPGTGKTHFLATAIISLAEAHRAENQRLRILVTAFTHAAINNLLKKIHELDNSGGLRLGKVAFEGTGLEGVAAVPAKSSWAWAEETAISVLGSTVWQIPKGVPPQAADVVVIDEGSQMKVTEAALAVRRLAPHGRLVVAGDDLQLPPIVHGIYPETGEDQPMLHRSVFESIRRRDAENEITAILLENFRMNRTLCAYPAQQIYTPEYTSATDEIAERTIGLDAQTGDALVDAILDPDYPLVIGLLRGVRATAENRVEAGIVARTALGLRRRLLSGLGSLYPDDSKGDQAFWKDGLFIVSPHHAQINAVRRALDAGRDWHSEPFVDTVDKMQGQECDAVIATYGVSDVEYAMEEKEFIYSLNRLNVSITRARAKTIVFLPVPLIEPPIHAFEDDDTARGIAFMQGLVRFARITGTTMPTEPLGEGASLTVLRVSGRASQAAD